MITRTERTPMARRLRRQPTEAEALLWHRLRNRQLDGWKFKRQFPIDRFVVDFCCADARLVVELDGGQHGQQTERDAARTEVLSAMGYLVVRFWNHDVLSNVDGVLESIARTIKPHAFDPPHPNPLPDGERESR
ncbi:endonuclease domain-containing protein [Rhodopseudomonas palustris]|uniref:Endonuclease domain-containing protein n=1 Tax=Rhodopseudomonas palustris TaxID=1076 RepID=A0A418VGB7_RHOPL|nr:endonuclease domain-containing protein [Rhodopseudomonas palustris]RJF75165.1 endonuclease domain-containing protein [Rhodopseudomonas palustris]